MAREGKTAIGLDENLTAVVAYALGWITGAAMLIMERENRFVRFHALQSTIVFGTLSAVWFIAPALPVVGWIVSFIIVPPLSAGLWLLLLFKAYHGERFQVPFAGPIAEQRTAGT